MKGGSNILGSFKFLITCFFEINFTYFVSERIAQIKSMTK